MALILIGRLQAATDQTMATLVHQNNTAVQSAVDSRIAAVAASIIANDPTILASAKAAVDAAADDAGFLRGSQLGAVRTTPANHPVYAEVRLTHDFRQAGGILRMGGEVSATPGTVAAAIKTGEGVVLLTRDFRRMDQASGAVSVGYVEIVGWGDSMTTDYASEGIATIAAIAQEVGVKGIDQGRSGNTPVEVAWRMGALRWAVTVPGGTIPATGEVAVALTPTEGFYNAYLWDAFVSDGSGRQVPVRLRCTSVPMGGSPTWTIEQIGGTSPVTILPDTRVRWQRPSGLEALPAVFWVGRNDSAQDGASAARTRAAVEAMLSQHRDPLRRRLVLPVFNRATEPEGSAGYARVMEMNEAIAEAAGADFFDARRVLIDHGLQAVGLTPTPDDLTAITEDRIPPALMLDITHLNATGRWALARLVGNELKARNW